MGRWSLHPAAVAGALVMLSHATARQDAFAVSKVGRNHLIEALSLVLHATFADGTPAAAGA